MNINNLDKLLSPSSVAIIGASSSPTKIGGRPLLYLQKYHYGGKIFPINPNYEKVGKFICYPDLESVPQEVDVAIVSVPQPKVISELKKCVRKGVKVAIVFTSGFAETGTEEGIMLQNEIKDLATTSGMRVLGPNCLGAINFKEGFTGAFTTSLTRDYDFSTAQNTAFITQSGAFGIAINALFYDEGQGFGYFIHTGNESDIELADCLYYIVEKGIADVIALYCEGIRDKDKFFEALSAAKRKKIPLVISKVGVSAAGGRAASSHTGAMVGSDDVYQAVFKKYGLVRANDTESVFDFVSLASTKKMLKGDGLAIITISGGAGVFLSDKCAEVGLKIPQLLPETKRRLREILPAFAAVTNPVDCTAQLINDPTLLEKGLQILTSAENIDGIVVFINLYDGYERHVADTIKRVSEKTDKYIMICWMSPTQGAVELFRKENIPILTDPGRTVNALKMLLDCYKGLQRVDIQKEVITPVDETQINAVKDYLLNMKSQGIVKLSEYESKQVLKIFKLPVPEDDMVDTVEAAVRAAERIGYPVVMKIESPDILHKTDAKCVKLGINNAEEIQTAFNEITINAKTYNSNAKILGINIQKQVEESIEMIVGIRQDPVFGPCIVIGSGGIMAEIIKDYTIRLLPVSKIDVAEMIEELKVGKLLKGFRGRIHVDINYFLDMITNLGNIAYALRDIISEMEINPLFISEEGVKAGDAMIILK